jgi:hypothetical protein
MPRNRSTNTRSLSNRISTLQREINPSIQVSGDMTSGNRRYVTRKIVQISSTTSGSLDYTPATLNVPDGAKILSLKCYSLDTRVLTCVIPNDTGIAVNNGNSASPFSGFTRQQAAPLSRFPMIKINIPDLLAAPLDAVGTTKLFTLSANGATTATFRVVFTAKYLA